MYFILPVFDAVRMGVRLRVSRDGLGGGTHNEMFSEIVVGRKVLGHGAREGQKKQKRAVPTFSRGEGGCPTRLWRKEKDGWRWYERGVTRHVILNSESSSQLESSDEWDCQE